MVQGRWKRDAELVRLGREALVEAMKRADVPPDEAFYCELAAGEALSNAMFYGRGEWVRYRLTADGHHVSQEYSYDSAVFETNRKMPDGEAQEGRGIPLMKEICQGRWRFSGEGVRVTLERKW